MFILILLIVFHSITPPVIAVNSQTFYAKILFEQVYFYKSPIDDNSSNNVYFELPKTYFVELLSKHGDFYEARYLDLFGYVKKDCVQAVSSTPSKPFLEDVNFRVYAELSQSLWSSPYPNLSSTNLVTTLPNLTKNLNYYGTIQGESLIEGRTNIWYFCKYSAEADYYGYIYSDFCDEMTAINQNNENISFITNPTFETNIQQPKSIPTNNNSVGIIIGILSIPALIFVFLLLKGTNILSKEPIKRKEVIDY